MKRISTFAIAGALAVIALSSIVPSASADSQKNKNNWRNGAIGAGAIGLYGLHNHDKTTAILGGVGAAYSAKRYEDARKGQARDSRNRARYYRLHHRHHHYRHSM